MFFQIIPNIRNDVLVLLRLERLIFAWRLPYMRNSVLVLLAFGRLIFAGRSLWYGTIHPQQSWFFFSTLKCD